MNAWYLQYKLLNPTDSFLNTLPLFHSTALESYLGGQMTDSICNFSLQHYACLPQVAFTVKMFVRYGPSWLNNVKRLHSFYRHNYSKALCFHDLFLLFQNFELSPEQLSMLIECKLSGKMSYPKEMWKLFFTKFSANLGNALHMLSNTVKTMAHSQSAVW